MSDPAPIKLWEILVPTERPTHLIHGKNPYFTVKHHRQWDAKVMAITGGLTIHPATKGQWEGPDEKIFRERMIPVRIACTEEQIRKIGLMTAKFYGQLVVMITLVSDYVIFINHPNPKKLESKEAGHGTKTKVAEKASVGPVKNLRVQS